MIHNQVIQDPAAKQQECWRVLFNGCITSPCFNSKGAAQAYLDLLTRGQRQPEYANG